VTAATFSTKDVRAITTQVSFLQSTNDIRLQFPQLDFATLHLLVCTDASFGIRPDKSSQAGYFALLADSSKKCCFLAYHSSKTRRVARFSMSEETFAFADGFDCAFTLRAEDWASIFPSSCLLTVPRFSIRSHATAVRLKGNQCSIYTQPGNLTATGRWITLRLSDPSTMLPMPCPKFPARSPLLMCCGLTGWTTLSSNSFWTQPRPLRAKNEQVHSQIMLSFLCFHQIYTWLRNFSLFFVLTFAAVRGVIVKSPGSAATVIYCNVIVSYMSCHINHRRPTFKDIDLSIVLLPRAKGSTNFCSYIRSTHRTI
jgi:hypothetical protein